MSLQTIDAGCLAKMFLAGAKRLESKKEWINELNVFPVPDGDTGTNMTLTIMSAAKDVAAMKEPDMVSLSKAISSGSLRGARGNSGVILSQLFRGFTKGIRDYDVITIPIMAAAGEKAVETAYKAVMKPKEGTILTVAKGASMKARELADAGEEDMEKFLKEIIDHAEYVLSQTPEMLPVLKQAGVVDSGGQYVGGTTDVTRTIVLGPVSDEIKEHFTAVAIGMLSLTHARFLYGCTGRNLDILARQPMWNRNIDYKCGTGHGVGYILNVHEGPQGIRWRFTEGQTEAVIEAGMDVTNEPGIYIEDSHGIRTENVMVARNGVKNGDGQFMYFDTLTWVPIDLDGIDTKYMQPQEVAWLNSYHAKVYEKIAPLLTEEEREWLKEATRPVK